MVLKNLPLSLRLHTQFMDEPVEEPARYYVPQSAVLLKKGLTELGLRMYVVTCPRHPVILSESDWGMQSPSQHSIYRLHYHSHKVIGSLGMDGG